jgi:preprotein translocase subunit YajC
MYTISLLQTSSTASFLVNILPILAIVGIFYFMVIAPANKQRRKTQQMLEALKKGDRVLTTGGIYGTVQGVESDVVHLRIAENVKIRVAKSSIASLAAGESSAD